MNVAEGALVGGRYRLSARIASGGAGQVWSAVDETLGRPVAVKLLRADVAHDDAFRERFRREARAAAALNHPGVAIVHDYGTESTDEADLPYLVMELVPGEALDALLRREAPLPPRQVADLLTRTAAALAAAHERGVVHRDVKPSNLLVCVDGTVKVTDFGIAQVDAAAQAPLTRTGTVLGTVQYLSPEQASGTSVGPAVDVYALGVVAHECLTGTRPFSADSPLAIALAHVQEPPPALPSDVPQALADLVMSMLAKDPDARPSAAEVARRAETLRDDLPAGPVTSVLPVAEALTVEVPHAAAAPAATTAALRSPRRRTGVLAVVLAVALLALGIVGAALVGGDDPDETPVAASTVTVPPIVGETRAEAVAMLRAAGLDADVVVRAGAGAPGVVASQRPDAGGQVPPDSVVAVVVGSTEADGPVAAQVEREARPAGPAKEKKDEKKKGKAEKEKPGKGHGRGQGHGNGR